MTILLLSPCLVFKGFCPLTHYALYIFINGKDFPAAKLFTIMHGL